MKMVTRRYFSIPGAIFISQSVIYIDLEIFVNMYRVRL